MGSINAMVNQRLLRKSRVDEESLELPKLSTGNMNYLSV